MKKYFVILMSMIFILTLTACGNEDNTENNSTLQATKENKDVDTSKENSSELKEDITKNPENTKSKTLVVYFSWSPSGNTEKMANTIIEQTDGTLYEIVPAKPYPEDYTECTEVALEERDDNIRPEIKDLPESLEEYDRIIIGFPIWWHTAPMIIGTFLENYDLTGVDIYPFSQSASMNTEQFDASMEFIRECANGADIHEGLFVKASDTDSIEAYLTENGLIN